MLKVAVLVHDLAECDCDSWLCRSEGGMASLTVFLRWLVSMAEAIDSLHLLLLVVVKDFQTFKMVVATSVGSTPVRIYGSGAMSASHLSSCVLA